MLVSQREAIHTRIADELQLDEANMQDNFALVVVHCESSGDMARTRKFLLMAGMNAREMGNELDAIFFLKKLIDLDTKTKGSFWKANGSDLSSFKVESGKILLHLGMASYSVGEAVESRTYLEAGLKLLGERIPTSKHRRLFGLLKWYMKNVTFSGASSRDYHKLQVTDSSAGAAEAWLESSRQKRKYMLRFGDTLSSTGATELIMDIGMALGTIGQVYVVLQESSTKYMWAMCRMYAGGTSFSLSRMHLSSPLSNFPT
jgi:hypothetical protein